MTKIVVLFFTAILLSSAIRKNSNEELAKSIVRGKLVYNENCASCHLGNGEGVLGTFPPLAKADYLVNNPLNGIKAVKFGLEGKIIVNGEEYDNMMPSPGLDDSEVADVMNFILNTWGNDSEGAIITESIVENLVEKK